MRILGAFLTGHSVRGCTGLSSLQLDFQRRTSLPLEQWLPYNFPYVATHPFPEATGLLAASFNNGWHFWSSRFKAFGRRYRAPVTAAFGGADRVLLVAGSCGLELLDNLGLEPEVLARLHVLALGPVSRRLPAVARCHRVQGRWDRLSAWYHPQVEQVIPGGHLDYLARPEVLAAFEHMLADLQEEA